MRALRFLIIVPLLLLLFVLLLPVHQKTSAAGTIHSNIDLKTCASSIQGWACQDGYDSKVNRIDIYRDGTWQSGKFVGNTQANLVRNDVKTVCGGFANHGFVVPSQYITQDGKAHSYYVYAIDASGASRNILISNAAASLTCSAAIHGTVAATSCSTGIKGWACQDGFDNSANRIDVYSDGAAGTGKKIGSINATTNYVTSPSLTAVCGGTINHGFTFTSLITDGHAHNYYMYAVNPNTNKSLLLSGKSFPLTCSSGPTPSPSPTSGSTSVKIVLGLPGIGYSGLAPHQTTRPITVELYAPAVQNPGGPGTTPLKSATGIVTYDGGTDNNAGYFVSNTPISFQNLASGKYQILIKVQRYLYKLAVNAADSQNPHVFTLNANTTTTLDPLILPSGDVAITSGQLNHLNILDYNVLVSCYGNKATTSSCPVSSSGSGGTNLADLNDDGKVDFVDLNIWLRSLRDLQAANAPGCDAGDCQGD